MSGKTSARWPARNGKIVEEKLRSLETTGATHSNPHRLTRFAKSTARA
jgi:hypothetical protein